MNKRYPADHPLRHVDSAGAAIFRMENGVPSVLVIRSGSHWSFPKGHIEPGETPEETALREIREETGVTVRILPGFRHDAPSPRAGDHRMIYGFAALYESGAPRPQPGETDEVRWMPITDAAAAMRFACDGEMILQAWAYAVHAI